MIASCLIVWSGMVLSAENDLRDVEFFTEAYPPANFIQDERMTGYSVDILLAASEMVNEPITMSQITLQPWARSYRTVLTRKNSILFSTTRSEHREALFQWVGPIVDIKVVVLARKDAKIAINDPLDMANYRIGVIRDDIGEQSLLELGIPREAMQEASYVTVLAEQLMKKRIDLLVYAERAAFWWSRQAGVDPDIFEVVYVVKQGDVYYAVNRDTSAEVVKKLQKGLDMLKQTDESGSSRYQEILANY
ncbi:transporter substrate-binding domain-containing protein [Vibrio sp. JPW-9-11-11]|uniref:substrate-binding periplasmic protein n=1 Tax=Vibrio sp. JPW-9-11-11 TaxID=1416532 RepID=UPI001594B0D0|nr:transporter substrate-binding domain-containing protein [Vibrio sp. JPW-9-11-11]NVD08888.1 transporter substrate-binding domain-containing protein [Vibrio sp. JPW-9-11-11]